MKGWFMTYPMLLPHTLAWFMMPHIQTAGYKVTALSCVFAAFKPGFLTKTGQKSQRRTAAQLFFGDSIPIMLIWSVTLLGSRSPLKHS